MLIQTDTDCSGVQTTYRDDILVWMIVYACNRTSKRQVVIRIDAFTWWKTRERFNQLDQLISFFAVALAYLYPRSKHGLWRPRCQQTGTGHRC